MNTRAISLLWLLQHKSLQIGWLSTTESILSWFWRPEDQSQGRSFPCLFQGSSCCSWLMATPLPSPSRASCGFLPCVWLCVSSRLLRTPVTRFRAHLIQTSSNYICKDVLFISHEWGHTWDSRWTWVWGRDNTQHTIQGNFKFKI